ncbi:MAG: alpha-galactosidase, partial [Bacteroidetes bacterium]
MRTSIISISVVLSVLVLFSCSEKIQPVWLDDMNIAPFAQGIRPFKTKSNYLNDTISVGNVKFERGVGGISPGIFAFKLNGKARRFTAEVGVDDAANPEIPLKFYVLGDRKILFESGEMKVGDAAKKVDVDLTGIQRFGLLVVDDIGGVRNKRTFFNWANAKFHLNEGFTPEEIPNSDEKYILTPEPPASPVINSARIFGATPGNPFLYTIAASGKRPIQFSAENLPQGLAVDTSSGIISGRVSKPGVYQATLKAKNEFGEAQKSFTIKIGDTIALTPPMGWNGWNSWESKIDREKVIASAEAMVKSGLINYGWTYINIDDTWQGVRGGKLNALQPNEKFPDIKGMVDTIHSLGLKAGLYSTPYISTYASYVGGSSDYPEGGETHELIKPDKQPFMRIGKYRFEENDALQMAEWGFDFLKYDWRIDVNSTERMSAALKKSGRDIVFSISNNAPFEKAAEWSRLTNMWRTGPDIKDNWNSLYTLAFTIDNWAEFAGPGHWNDPDM